MTMFHIFRKYNERSNRKKDLAKLQSTVPCFESFELVADGDKADPQLYKQITNIVASEQLNVNEIPIYSSLKTGFNQEDFDYFYEEWVDYLWDRNYLCYLDTSITLEEFTSDVNLVLKARSFPGIVFAKVEALYYEELKKRGVYSKINHDILFANTIATILKERKLELIGLFAGNKKEWFAVIRQESILELRKLEEEIK